MGQLQRLLLALGVALAWGEALAQQWEWLNPLPTSYELHDLAVVTEDRVIVVGNAGVIASTTDHGQTWRTVFVDAVNHFASVSFADESNGWAAGSFSYNNSSGAIFHTNDGGLSWVEQFRSDSEGVADLCFSSPLTGWATGGSYAGPGLLIRTTNGGMTWENVSDTLEHHGFAIYFVNDFCGWTVGQAGSVLHTNDGGASWQRQDVDYSGWLYDVMFTDERNGFISADDGIVFVTHDGGNSWVPRYAGRSGRVVFQDSLNGFIGNDDLSYTTDGGENWHPRAHSERAINAMALSPGGHLWSVGREGIIMESADAGETWAMRTQYQVPSVEDIHFLDDDIGWAVGEAGLYVTYDGGEIWRSVDFSGQTPPLVAVEFVDWSNGFVLDDHNRVWRTTDGGETWAGRGVFFYDNVYSPKMDFTDDSVGYIGYTYNDEWDWYSLVAKTTDGGLTWANIVSMTNDQLGAVSFPSRNHGYLLTDYGELSYTHDGGESWTRALWGNFDYSYLQAPTDSICFVWYEGLNGLSRTRDGGATWEGIPNSKRFVFSDALHGVALVGWTSYHTSDGGYTWDSVAAMPLGSGEIFIVDSAHIWASGAGAALIRLRNEPESVTDERFSPLPAQVSLTNYPNPFNPTTTLEFALPQAAAVRLQVFDVTGRLTATLVDEQHPAGKVSTQFDATNLAAGLYFARLQVGQEFFTRKLLLVK